MKYKYKHKYVNSVDEFIAAIDDGYMGIIVPKRLRPAVLERLTTLKKKSDDYLFAYASCQHYFIDSLSRKKEAYDAAIRLANKETAKGFLALGYCYWRGIGVEPNKAKALEWFQKGADKGEALCLSWMALIYDELGQVEKAVEYYAAASKRGVTAAKNNFSYMYQKGRGVPVDKQKAFALMLEAAQDGDPAAQANLALYYKEGDVVERSPNDAIYWYLKSAAAGNEAALRGALASFGIEEIFARVKIKKPNE